MSNKIIIFSLTVLKAEIYWALHKVMSTHSARLTDKVSDLFPKAPTRRGQFLRDIIITGRSRSALYCGETEDTM